jgi:hypothetical protein
MELIYVYYLSPLQYRHEMNVMPRSRRGGGPSVHQLPSGAADQAAFSSPGLKSEEISNLDSFGLIGEVEVPAKLSGSSAVM